MALSGASRGASLFWDRQAVGPGEGGRNSMLQLAGRKRLGRDGHLCFIPSPRLVSASHVQPPRAKERFYPRPLKRRVSAHVRTNRQPFKVLATETINQKALDADIYNAIPTEKVDGTCCYITTYKGQPYLWARLDRKPNKQAEKRFKRYLYSADNSKGFAWNIDEDFKPIPECWIPAKEIKHCNGKPFPDENGHIPGWVPVEKNSKQYCWHTSVVDYEFELALVLKHHMEQPGLLEISPVSLSSFSEQTLELIGTSINANPYASSASSWFGLANRRPLFDFSASCCQL